MIKWVDPSEKHFLYSIHKTLLYLVENHNAKGKKNNHKHKTVYQPPPAYEVTTAEESVLEGFNNRGYRVEAHELVYRDTQPEHTLCLAQRVNNRSSVHP